MKAIVSLANERGNYYKGLCRLGESLRGNFDGDFFGFMGEHSVGAPKHHANHYAFKIYAIDHVKKLGYRQILWLDSSVWAIKNVYPVFHKIQDQGYIMQEAGQFVGQWCNQRTLDYAGLTREIANTMPCYGNAGLLGLNFESAIADIFFNRWKKYMEDGQFNGSWKDHRHDLTCGSIIANDLGMKYEPGNEILQYAGPNDEVLNDTIIFKAQGC
jgi:hypothetical protein